MGMRSLVLSMCVLASPALAEDFFLKDGEGLSFTARGGARAEACDFSVRGNVLTSKYGVRREKGREQLASSTALSLGDVMLVKDASGAFQRVRVLSQVAGLTHLVWFDGKERVGARASGRYVNSKVTVNGAPAEAIFGQLELDENGRFTLGRAHGTWSTVEGRLTLSTFSALWGYPTVLEKGDVLVFRFIRDRLDWEVTFERSHDTDDRVAVRLP
jgi:hypothetical protein